MNNIKKIKIGILTGIILISTLFLFIQPIKAETEIVPIYPEEDVSISGMWDEDGIFLSDYNYWEYDLYLGGDLYSGGELRTKHIIFLKFNMPNRTLNENESIKSMKVRLTQENNYGGFVWSIKTDLVENTWVSENMTWDNQPKSIGSSIITNLTFVNNVISNHYIDLASFIDYIENGTVSIKIECLTIGVGYDVIQFISKERGEVFERPVLIVEYKEEEEPNPPNPFTLTSNADTPDIDGFFTLYWISSENSDNYSIYKDGVLFNSGWIYTEYYMIIDSNGHYNFTVIAFNEYGNTSSNEITIIVEIPPPPKPNPFMLTSNANNPDMDGIFTLYWTESTHTDTYSIYQNDILVDNKLTTLHYDIRIYLDGSYNFKVIAINDYGNMSSNEVNVNIEIPLPPPNPFMLTSNADNPDADGIFMLYWSSSEYAKVYSVYCDGVLLEWGITNLYCNIKVYTSGSYNFKVVALNDYGQVDSNLITINVDIYIVEPEPELIPKPDVILYITMFTLIGVVIGSSLFYFGLKFKKIKNRKEAI